MSRGLGDVYKRQIYNRVSNQKEKNALIEENKKLSEQLAEYSAQIKVYEQENYELKRLQELLNLKEQYKDYNTIGARVIATDSTNWFYTFVIDKGSEDGVKVGCNILAGNGLAGIVTEVGSNYAKVRSIIDDNSNISANISGTETLCTVSGDLSLIKEGYINVSYINKMDTIEEGAELVTSHVSDKFLPGLLIGYITDVQMDANNLTKSAKCIPVVDFNNLQEVLVVLDLKADYDTDSNNKNIYDSIQSTEASTTEQSSTQETSQDNARDTGDNTSEENTDDNSEENDNLDNTSESQTRQDNQGNQEDNGE